MYGKKCCEYFSSLFMCVGLPTSFCLSHKTSKTISWKRNIRFHEKNFFYENCPYQALNVEIDRNSTLIQPNISHSSPKYFQKKKISSGKRRHDIV